jgi:hypothetical protein
MKTIILIGIALVLGCTVKAQGWAAAHGSGDGFAFDPYTMSKMPTNSDGINTSPVLIKMVPFHIRPVDGHPAYPPALYWAPLVTGNQDAIPKIREASFVVMQHDRH